MTEEKKTSIRQQATRFIATQNKLHLSTVTVVYDAVLDYLKQHIADNATTFLPGFGTFATTLVPAREARNLQTGEPLTIPEHMAVKFRAASQLKAMVNDPGYKDTEKGTV